MRYTTVADLERRLAAHRELQGRLQDVVVELAAALIRADRNGYQAKVVESCLQRAGVSREKVDAFNVQRAARIARWKARNGD